MRQYVSWIGKVIWPWAVVAVLVAAVAYTPPSDPLSSVGVPEDSDYHLYVIFQDEDCEGRLTFVRPLQDSLSRKGMSVSGLHIGDSPSAEIAEVLELYSVDIPLEPLPRKLAYQSTFLGYSLTPFLVLVDRAGRVRFTAEAPVDPASEANLLAVIRGIAANVGDTEL